MTATINVNPYAMVNAPGTFQVQSDGYVQGMLMDNPVELFKIAGGLVASTETVPMWGGIAITENVPNLAAGSPDSSLGGGIARATTVANITGFTVFNQAHHMVQTPQSPVPLAASGNSINFVRKGSGARLAVACDPALASLEGGAINANVSWDFHNQILQPYDASTATVSVASAAWAAGVYTLTVTTSGLIWTPVAGDFINVSGATNTGTGGTTVVNGNFQIASVETSGPNTLIHIAAPAAAGVFGTIAGTIILNVGVGALGLYVEKVLIGNSMTVLYDAVTGFATWNRSGSAAIIIL